ncbi:MAG: hypothetical protein LC779_07305 [Actinobacteria bacterium]|nr:hypothetical protein [Actinomycetota bacterium]
MAARPRRGGRPGPRPGVCVQELYVGAAVLEVSPEEARDLFAQVLSRLG